jgi:SPP1 family predicted phage head-tail adaptor
MRAGDLTQRLTLQTVAITQDSELNPIKTYTDWRTVWAQPLEETSREFYRLSTMNAEVTKVFRIRYIAGVNAHQRIKFKGRHYEIIGDPINELERNETLLLACKGAV